MDLWQAIKQLSDEKKYLDRAIESLTMIIASESVDKPVRRGRKYMSPAERLTVSERMKNYWASRREHRG